LCKPVNGSTVYVGYTYYITWDTSYYTTNSSIIIQGNYVNQTLGEQAFQSPQIQNSWGFYSWTVDNSWLQGYSSNNITLVIMQLNPSPDKAASSMTGQTLMITNYVKEPYRQPKSQAPKGQSLYIALPTVFGFIILSVCGGCLINRRHRKIGLGNVMGRRNGYGVGKSRTQRMGLGKKDKGAIRLREQELTAEGQYRDTVPIDQHTASRGHARADSDALGSLAGTPTEERQNYFRDEMRRQEERRY
jgi:hypothetical protein